MHPTSNRRNKGFTLIELMIVIAIIGILAAVAVPQYTIFTARSFVSTEGFSAARPFQQAINEHYVLNQSLPANVSDLRLSTIIGDTSVVQSVAVASDGSGFLTVLFKSSDDSVPANIQGQTLVLTPNTSSGEGNIDWSVSTTESTINASFLPRL